MNGLYDELVRMVHNPATTDIAVDLLCMVGTLGHLDGEPYFQYVDHTVWTSPTRTAFYLETPLQHVVAKFVEGRYDPSASRMIDFFVSCIDHGANVPLLAQHLFPTLCKLAILQDTDVTSLCALLRQFALDEDARWVIMDPPIFRVLATRTEPTQHVGDVVAVIEAMGESAHPDVVGPVVARCAVLLGLRATHLEGAPQMRRALALLEMCARRPEWRPRLVDAVVTLLRHDILPILGPLLAAMLTGTSVELVLRLHRASHLGRLARAANAHAIGGEVNGIVWRAVRAQLRHQWPAKMTEILDHGIVGKRRKLEDAGGHTCPITHMPMHHPVVASDGHTYERDALMEHMASSGPVSPMTREVLEYHLYPNRAIV